MAKKSKKAKVKGKVRLSSIPAVEDEEFDFLEENEWYPVEFVDAETNMGNYGPYLLLKFVILKGETEGGKNAKGREVTRILNAVLSPSQALWPFAKVFLGREPKIGESIDLTAYYGERYRGLVKFRKQKKGETKKYQTIDAIKKMKSKK